MNRFSTLNNTLCYRLMRIDTLLLAMRPKLTIDENQDTSEIEKFQNNTLRPILKFQNDLLVALVNDAPHFARIQNRVSSADEYKSEVISFIKQQSALKNQIIGLIVGHFTLNEFSDYVINRNELNKRIVQMAGERVAVWEG